MNRQLTGWGPALLAAAVAALAAAPAQAEEADAREQGVLGGSPPIYAGPPAGPVLMQSYKRYRVVPRGDAPALPAARAGDRCATELGLYGPGPLLPVDAVCAGRGLAGQLVRGRVVAAGSGKFCATAAGLFGPGTEQPLGMPCRAETKNGVVIGRITTPD